MTNIADLPPEQAEALRAQFEILDANGDGRVSQDEIEAILGREAYAHLDAADRQRILDSFSGVDADGDGSITLDEYLTLFIDAQREDAEDATGGLRHSFDQYDTDGDGYLTAEDFQRVSEQHGEALTNEQARAMIQMADANEDGRVSFDEFCKIMQA
ncbi:MAG: EF-hand domain-containing protein [Nannocystaceae bacterium]